MRTGARCGTGKEEVGTEETSREGEAKREREKEGLYSPHLSVIEKFGKLYILNCLQ